MLDRAFNKINIFKIFTLFIFLTALAFSYSPSYAAESDPTDDPQKGSAYTYYCQGNWYAKDPHPISILCPIARFFNVLVLSVGAMFLIFVFFSALKYAMAQGDPKALQAAKQTLTLAITGMLVVLGVFTILTIIKSIFGIKEGLINSPFDMLAEGLNDLFLKLNIRYEP